MYVFKYIIRLKKNKVNAFLMIQMKIIKLRILSLTAALWDQ